jgi:hypothetical protein
MCTRTGASTFHATVPASAYPAAFPRAFASQAILPACPCGWHLLRVSTTTESNTPVTSFLLTVLRDGRTTLSAGASVGCAGYNYLPGRGSFPFRAGPSVRVVGLVDLTTGVRVCSLALSIVACYRCRPVGLGLNPDSAPLHGLMASRYRGGGAVPRHHGGRESHPTSVSKLSRSHLLAGPPTCPWQDVRNRTKSHCL